MDVKSHQKVTFGVPGYSGNLESESNVVTFQMSDLYIGERGERRQDEGVIRRNIKAFICRLK